ncbi:hypothetical protein Daus18300_005461 [Diaporthe australafricana]|uniref:Fungal STAND N-terminal Goodbye domain-containing protein n=1 Tax=Diaporthe australafricana TaxID=127596 RepID=A0ABR3X1P1_9PEZI
MSGRISTDSADNSVVALVQRPMRSDTWASTSTTGNIVASAYEAIPVSQEAITRWAEHVKALDDEQRKTFLRQMPDGDLINYAEAVDKVIDTRILASKVGRSSKWITPLVDFFNICKPLTDCLGEAYPPARLVLGGVMFALSMTQRLIKYQESLVQFLTKVMSSLGQLEEFRTTFPDTSEIQEALVDVFDIILQICARVSTLFMNNKGKQKSSLRLFPRSFDKDFGEWSQLLDLNLDAFDRTINLVSVKKLGHLQETQMTHIRMQLSSYKAFHASTAKQAQEDRERVMRQIARDQG